MVTFWKGAGGPRTKYNARHVRCEMGSRPHTHDSMAERNRCYVLHTRQERGEISGLMIHERWKLVVNEHLVSTYESDFSYHETVDGEDRFIVEDVKSQPTAARVDYRLKRALMEALFGIVIREVSG